MRARPNADLATARLVDSGNLTDTDRVSTIGAEAMLPGPFKAQAEYYTSKAKRYDHDNYTSDGYYISGVWNVTGETWSYKGGTPGTGLPDNPAAASGWACATTTWTSMTATSPPIRSPVARRSSMRC